MTKAPTTKTPAALNSPARTGDAAKTPGRWRAPVDWRDRLSARTPEGILERIVDGDPLGLRRLVGEVIRKQRRVADGDRVHLRAIACIAHRAISGDGADSPRWIEERVEEALFGVLATERAKLDAAEPPAPKDALAVLAGPLGLDPMDLRRACSALNERPDGERAAFFSLIIDRVDLDAAAASASVTSVELARRARRALDAVIDSMVTGTVESGSEQGREGVGTPTEKAPDGSKLKESKP